MRKYWPMTWCLTGIAGLLGIAGPVMGQAAFEAPQYPQYVQYPQGPPVTPADSGEQVTLNPDQMDQLLGPIALYPDPLLALVFPAATYPQEVVAAERWLSSTPDVTESAIDAQNWDGAVKSLAHYPTVLSMMNAQINWTQSVGAAYLNQPKDVLASVQRLRAQAQAAKNLQTTPQEQVVANQGTIYIEPADPNMMYVPTYDPNLVYASEYPVSFSAGYPIGLWCDNDFDWNNGYIENGGGWYHGWHHPEDWDRHRPAWDHHPDGWKPDAKRWDRAARGVAPRLTASSAAHIGVDRPGGTGGTRSTPGARSTVGRGSAAQSSRNAFEPLGNRAGVQRAVRRTQPRAVQPAARVQPRAAARPAAHNPMPRRQASAPRPPSRSNAFRGNSSGSATRTQSSRGHASSGGGGRRR